MLLSKPDILAYLRDAKLRFDPPISEDRVAQVSVDLKLGRKFTTFKQPPKYLPCINVDRSLWESADLWEHSEADTFRLMPGGFVLAQTLERVYVPPDLAGFVEGRSSWARIGITIHVTAPKIDPGFNATITLEMANFGKIPVELRAGIDEPAQLMLFKLSTPVPKSDLYGMSDKDLFQGQSDPIPHKK
ncbi:MAG TPA: dCTP deaminase [Thermoanaerobaculia bacterium]|nr:dCTP deaminase [Thermoanaerobaculia bacterium]